METLNETTAGKVNANTTAKLYDADDVLKYESCYLDEYGTLIIASNKTEAR
jgi:hypothetical protein